MGNERRHGTEERGRQTCNGKERCPVCREQQRAARLDPAFVASDTGMDTAA